ncbi:cannabinoid receptor 1-like, partial [Paramuricea clavata]
MNATAENKTLFLTCYILTNKATLIKDFSSGTEKIIHVATLVFCICLFLFTVVLNTVTVGTIWTIRSLSEKVSYFSIMVQSAIDLANGVVIFPMFIAHLSSEISGSPSCDATYVMLVLLCLFYLYSMTSLSMLNFERYMGILHPLFHRAKVTKTRILTYVVVVCGIQTVFAIITLPFVRVCRYLIGGTSILLAAMTVFVYTSICCSRFKNSNYPGNCISHEFKNQTKMNRARFKKELKLAKACFIVVLNFLICNVAVVHMAFKLFKINDEYIEAMHKKWAFLFMLSNSTINSLVYFWQNKDLRVHAKAFLRKTAIRLHWKNPDPILNHQPQAYILASPFFTPGFNARLTPKHIRSNNADDLTLNPLSQSQVSSNPDSSHELGIMPTPRPSLFLNTNNLNCNPNLSSKLTPGQNLKSHQLGPLNPITLVCGRNGWVAYNAKL